METISTSGRYRYFSDYTNMNSNKNTGIEQFLHETQTWARALDFYKQENAFLKTRLSQVVDNNSDRVFLAAAEHFNNRFLLIDEYIAELRKDTRIQTDNIKQCLAGSELHAKNMHVMQKKLRSELERFEKEILNLKNDFHKKLVTYFEIS
jgi:hypothetical protein